MKNLYLGALIVAMSVSCGMNSSIKSGRDMADGQFEIDELAAEELREDLSGTLSDSDVMAILGDEEETVEAVEAVADAEGVIVDGDRIAVVDKLPAEPEVEDVSIFNNGDTRSIIDVVEDCLEENNGFKKKVSSCKKAVVCDLDKDGTVNRAEKRACRLQLKALVKGIEKDLVDCEAMGILTGKECKKAIRAVMKEEKEASKLELCDLDEDGSLDQNEKKLCSNWRSVAGNRKKKFKEKCAAAGFYDMKNKAEKVACKKALRGDKKDRFVTMFDENEDGQLSSAEVEFRKKKMKVFRIEEKKERLTNRLNKKLDRKTTKIDGKVTKLDDKIEDLQGFDTKIAQNKLEKFERQREKLLERQLKIEQKNAERLERKIAKKEKKQEKVQERIEKKQENKEAKQEAVTERKEIKQEAKQDRNDALAEATTKKEKKQIRKEFRQEVKETLKENCAYKKKKKRNKCLRNQ
jgi:hypothetical protein